MTSYDYDLFVIGAGSGGVRAARMSSSYGARVAIAEEYRFGGTCVIRGCVPKKLLVYAARFSGDFEDAAGFGWQIDGLKFDWQTLIANKDKEIDRLEGLYKKTLNNADAAIFSDRAELVDPHTIRLVEADRTLTARTILVATGGHPFKPDTPGAEHAITSNEAFHLKELPKRITIVGAGYIAVEFASIFNGLGSQVTMIYRGELILRGFDDDIRTGLADEMQKRGVDILLNTQVSEITPDGDAYAVKLSNGDTLATDLVMYATGRMPNTGTLGLEQAGVELGRNGHVVVDDYSKSSVEHIFAVGDVTGRVALTPVAIREGAAFAESVFNDNPSSVDYSGIPTAVFSEPEIGTVGLTEAEAREKHPKLKIYKSSFRPMKHTLSGRDEKMIMKLLVDGETDRVVGCHMLGADAGEMAQILAITMRMGATKEDFDATVALHPSAAEELVTMHDEWQAAPDE
jgi:glutathione reductase (NADPH)